MAKAKLEGRKNTSVNLTEDQIAWIKANGYEISSLLRDLIDKFMENSMSSEELLLKKRQELLEQQKALESEIAVIDTQLGKKEEKKSFVGEVVKTEKELEDKRKEYVLSIRREMRGGGTIRAVRLDYIKEAYKFNDRQEVKEYILKTWVEAGAIESRVRKYLGLD